MLIGNSELLQRFLRNIYRQTLSIGDTEMFGKLGRFHGNTGVQPKEHNFSSAPRLY